MKRYLLIEYDPADSGLEPGSLMFDYLVNEFENAKIKARLHDCTLTGLLIHAGALAREQNTKPKKRKR